jgi:hypothetical protein
MVRFCLLLLTASFLFADKKPGQPPVIYSNIREIPASCDAIWGHIVPVVANRGFMPESSDKAGGFMKLRYTRGDGGWLRSDKDVKALTSHRKGLFETYDRFRVAGGAISLVSTGEKCTATLQLEYQGFRGSGFQKGWFALPSNNSLESRLLDDLEAATK